MPRARSSPAASRAKSTASPPPWAWGGTHTSVGVATIVTCLLRRARRTGSLPALDRLEHEQEEHGADEGDEDRPDVELVDPPGTGGVEQRAAEHRADDADDDREQASSPVELRDPRGQRTGDEPDDNPSEDAHRP